MKTKTSFRSIAKTMLYIMVFSWALLSFAQCPTITQPGPPISDASGLTFAGLDAIAAPVSADVIWYDTPTGGTAFNDNQLVVEGTYYAGDATGVCGIRPPLIVDFSVDPSGLNLDQFFCSNDNPTFQDYIDMVLQAGIPAGGSVEIYSDFDLTTIVLPTDLVPMGPADYFIVFINSGGDRSQIEIGSIAVITAPANPTPDPMQEFCSTTTPLTVAQLDPGTTAIFSWFDDIDGAGNPIPPALPLTTPLIDGNTYFVQIQGFCDSDPVAVTVTISDPVDAGISGTLEFCENDLAANSPLNLFDVLGGMPDTTGTWSGPLATTNGNLGTVNITLLTPGVHVFTYTVESNNACPDEITTVTITVFEVLNSGNPSTNNPISFCESGLPTSFDLFSLLDGTQDPGGQWTMGTLSTDPIVTSPIDLSGFTPATFNFTYTQNLSPNPCPEQSTTVQVIVLADPNAGVAVNATFCENDLAANSPFDLFTALDGSQDNDTGIWTDVNGDPVTNPIDITGFTVVGSPFSFTYTIDNGTCSDMETISITVDPAPESGTVNSSPEFCEGEGSISFDLFDLLDDEDQTGTWFVGTDNTGAVSPNVIDVSILTPGTFNFTYDVNAIGTCDDDLVTVTIIINALPNTGIATPIEFCENDLIANSPLNLFDQLTGNDIGGIWTDDDSSGALTGSNVDLTLLTIGVFNYTYSITDANSCSNSSTVTITILEAPESGTVNGSPEFCAADITTGQTLDLFDLLDGENQTGVWSDDTPSNTLVGNIVTLDGLAPGVYDFTYDVDAIGTCDDDLVMVTITINDTSPPTAATTQEFCDMATVADLIATGTGIQWYDEATGGTPLDPSTPLINGENYFSTQTDGTTGCESSIRLEVLVTIFMSPNSGIAVTPGIIACNDNTNIDLNTGLDGSQNTSGIWQDDDATGALTGVTNNIFDASGIAPGTYNFTYFVAASAPCIDTSTTITVIIEGPLSAGTDAVLDTCDDTGTVDLFTLIGPADVGGVWSPALASGTGVFDPLVDASNTYTYTLTNACGITSSDVVVTVTPAPNAGTDNAISICVIDGSVDLFTELGGTPDVNGIWSPALASGTGVFDPAVDTAGTYTYTVTAIAPCVTDASAQVTVTVGDTNPVEVINTTPEFCQEDNPTIADLDASITATGTIIWYTDATLTTALNLTDALEDGEDYFVTQTGASGCKSSEAMSVTVTVNDAPTPTLIDTNLELCINDGPLINDLTLNIAEFDLTSNNVVWYDAAVDGNVISNSTVLALGVTYYAALIDPTSSCESSVRLAVTPDLTACGDIVLPDGFSPNGDGVNDTFDFDNLDVIAPNFDIEIFNRNGNIVYRGNASTPRFDGTSNQSRVIGNGNLPVGVYFYILNLNDGITRPMQGRLYLSR